MRDQGDLAELSDRDSTNAQSARAVAARELAEQAHRRLYPGITDPHWLVLRQRRRTFEQWIAQLPAKELSVLDIGGRIQPYRSLLTGRLRSYFAIDLRSTPLVSAVARGEQLPFRANEFDIVICTQMLQYVPEPRDLVNEVARVLKPGGKFFLSVPGAYPIDSGHECWRFLPAGLRHLLSGFRRVEIVPEGGSISGLFRTMNACFDIFAKYPILRIPFRYAVCPAMNVLGASLERMAASDNQQFAVNYSVLAEK